VASRNWKLKIVAWLAVLPLAYGLGCARQLVPQVTGESSPAAQQLPFERPAETRGISPTSELMPAVIPTGTLVAVRLHSSLSSVFSHPGDTFDAILDEPIIIQGQTVAPQGAPIAGKVLDARPAGESTDAGYLRVVLTAVWLNGKFIPMQTSSVFAKGGPRGGRNVPQRVTPIASPAKSDPAALSRQLDVHYDPEQRLTFRLNEPLSLRG